MGSQGLSRVLLDTQGLQWFQKDVMWLGERGGISLGAALSALMHSPDCIAKGQRRNNGVPKIRRGEFVALALRGSHEGPRGDPQIALQRVSHEYPRVEGERLWQGI